MCPKLCVPMVHRTSVLLPFDVCLLAQYKPQALAAMQKPAFKVVPASKSSKLACKCATCKPLAGFPPVCTGCKCEEAMDDEGEPKEDVFMIGHTKACAEDKVCGHVLPLLLMLICALD